MDGDRSPTRRIYLDNAATTWPKPEAVYVAVERYQRECGVAAGRGAYRDALETQRTVTAARLGVARLLGAADPRRVIWTHNCTDALNLALHGLLRAGEHVVTTDTEHNSVLRPLRWLSDERGVRVTSVPCDATGAVKPCDVRRALRSDTRLVVINHASNVTGTVQPLAEIARIVREHGARLLVDAAQTLGQIPWDVDVNGPVLVAAAGHKSLLGPLGVGLLYVGPGLEQELRPTRQGGTGTHSEDDRQPTTLPDRYESGNLNVPGLVGLAAGVEFVRQRGVDAIAAHHQRLAESLRAGLRAIPGVAVFAPAAGTPAVGVVSCAVEGFEPHEVATILDAEYGVQVRAGLHCAPQIHRALGTLARGGTVRLSVGCWTTDDDVDVALRAIAAMAELNA